MKVTEVIHVDYWLLVFFFPFLFLFIMCLSLCVCVSREASCALSGFHSQTVIGLWCAERMDRPSMSVRMVREELAREALRRETGVRALRSRIEALLLDTMFELPDLGEDEAKTYVIAKEHVLGEKPLTPMRVRGKGSRKKNTA